jgi:protein-S-isoprenylcysteine O-methyltransferase Ste14
MFTETITILSALLLWGAGHSLTAALGVKAGFVRLFGARAYLGLYRLLYNGLSVLSLLPILALIATGSGQLVWQAEGALAGLLVALQGVGLLGLGVSLLQIDLWRFIGLRQALAYLALDPLPLPDEPLATGGVYALTRHPLYLFSLMVLWFMPTMTAGMLGFTLASTLYFGLGSLLEEQKVAREFGQAYHEYRQRVAWMIPFLRWP